jgi:anion-transporting  ArsA/GET3 family ATPase
MTALGNVPKVPLGVLDHRLIFVTGKGGVGKSTVALALAIAAARHGKRTIVAELGGDQRLGRPFGVGTARAFEEVQLSERLFTISIEPELALEEYLRVKTGPLGQALGQSRLFQALTMATPGMRELLVVGKVWELAQPHRRTRGADPYDAVVVDAPATGHGIAALRAPRTFAQAAKVGPIAHQGATIADTLADRDFTAVLAVATPEEMPVNETLQLHGELQQDQLDLDAVIINACYPKRFDDAEIASLRSALAGSKLSPRARAAIRAAVSEFERAAVQAQQRQRLLRAFEERTVELPYVFSANLERGQLERLAAELEPAL